MTVRSILTDIEGTTTDRAYVRNELLPYAHEQLHRWVRLHQHEAKVQQVLEEVCSLSGVTGLSEAIHQLELWQHDNVQAIPLKRVQGWIWEWGYHRGDVRGHLYDDVVPALRCWDERGIQVFVYSSGSVGAQRLLFGHTAHGDLTSLLSGNFDTRIGPKDDSTTYTSIARQMRQCPANVLYLSDAQVELDAAKQSGMRTIQLVRDSQVAGNHPVVSSFREIQIDSCVL